MGKKKSRDNQTSNGERNSVSKTLNIIKYKNTWDAYSRGKRVMVTIPNPNGKSESNKPFIRVTAQEAGWKKPERYHMKT